MEEIYRSQFRLPYALYEQLKASADKNHRSVNAELVARLEEIFSEHPSEDRQPAQSTTRISKEKLLQSLEQDRPATKKDLNEAVMEAMLTVMSALKDGPPGSADPAKGPRPRKKFPKE
ncbi:hypothetical protein CJF35_03295 [Pseudomonas lundensis]|uniref:Arc family DNA-binding protein n=1 Tax=Pseudomonas veronii TaxID=76761 RepID=A0A7Y1F7Y8_PSEVE|nr:MULTISPECIES: Arc family DNA-binding protein [Pseudomonas]NMY08511.1 Arc family DNA-binding protein [Pseudomonas veronii]OZY38607.1 hypothetical protein CJF35_03295 [Pseudomonas lundensis]